MQGSYTLILKLPAQIAQLPVGRLGRFDFAPGYYLYVGSAFGSGGIAARLKHHLRRAKPRPHWHIDYLREHALLEAAWTMASSIRMECRWCRRMAHHHELSVPIPGFGSRDTGCAAHLFYLPHQPPEHLMRELLLTDLPTDHTGEARIEIRHFAPELQ
jgi:Uri superfamily endonuclease